MNEQTVYHGSDVTVDKPLVGVGREKPNYQICILKQEIIDEYLHYKSSKIF
jgi:hypothetical protein